MLIEGQIQVPAPPAALIDHLFDAHLMASCLPGCESLEPLADDRYRAVVAVALAGVKARFNLQVQVTGRDASTVYAVTRGEEGSNASSLHADSRITLQPDGAGTLLSYRSEVSVTGRLGRFGLGVMKKKAQGMGDEFATNLCARLQQLQSEAPPPPAPVVAAPVPLWLRWWRALLGWLRGKPGSPASSN